MARLGRTIGLSDPTPYGKRQIQLRTIHLTAHGHWDREWHLRFNGGNFLWQLSSLMEGQQIPELCWSKTGR